MSNLVNGINTMIEQCSDTTLLGSFLENHDNPRFPFYTSDMSLAKNAIGFTMLADGIPIIYQGQEQHLSGDNVPDNRQAIWLTGYATSANLYPYITKLNKIRRQAINQDSSYVTSKAVPVYADSSAIVMRKGSTGKQVVAAFTNKGSSGNCSFSLTSAMTGFTAGQAVTDIIGCTVYSTDSSGTLAVAISGGLPQVFYPSAQLSGSGLCASTKTASTAAGTSAASSTLSTSVIRTSTTSSCATPTAVSVAFEQNVTTQDGQTIKLVGSISQLGSWNPTSAISLSDQDYSDCDPYWYVLIPYHHLNNR